ncbi:hypothetical protein JCM10213_002474 [Rhodosporidiobolus nylandii]
MHRFFDPVFEQLHKEVIGYLARPTIHGAFALGGVNNHFRRLVLARQLASLRQKGKLVRRKGEKEVIPPVGGTYIKASPFLLPPSRNGALTCLSSSQIHQGGDPFDEGVSIPCNDPRELFELDTRCFEEDIDDEFEPGRREPLYLFMSAYDPSTGMCTFKPPKDAATLDYMISCDPEGDGEEWGCCDQVPGIFQAASSGWFRPARKEELKFSHAGLVLAGKDAVQPSRVPVMWPKASQDRGGVCEQKGLRFVNGWKADVVTSRFDKNFRPSGDNFEDMWVRVRLKIRRLHLPLIDAFLPPTTAKDDLDRNYTEMTLAKYIEDDYKKKGSEEQMKEDFCAQVFEHAGGLVEGEDAIFSYMEWLASP